MSISILKSKSLKTLNTLRNEYRKKTKINFYKQILTSTPELKNFDDNDGLQQWLKRWRKWDKHISPLSYIIFSQYVGRDMDIMPLEICYNIVEPVLTPANLQGFYVDKNSLSNIISTEFIPKEYLKCIRGKFFSGDNNPLLNDETTIVLNSLLGKEKIVAKGSISGGGSDVKIFHRTNHQHKDREGNILSIEYLNKRFGENYLLQEYFIQSEFMAQFNPSSVNTIRILTYRSVIENKVVCLRYGLRMGLSGSEVDNACQGGMFIGIDDNGVLGKYVCNEFGNKKTVHNKLEFSKNFYQIPNFNNIKLFAELISSKVLHHDLIQLDIALDINNNPKIIEINTQNIGLWLFQYTSGGGFRKYTDEVMEYCSKKIKYITPELI